MPSRSTRLEFRALLQPGAAAVLPGVAVPSGAVAGVLPGRAEPSREGNALSAGAVASEAVVSTIGVREPPPAHPARAREPASRIGARRRRAGFMIEA